MKDDTISRRGAIKAIKDALISWSNMPEWRENKIAGVLDKLPSAQQWIPCKERLPEPGEYYLVTKLYIGWNCTEYREIDIAKYDFDGWHKADTVLAWCELPEPWKGGGDD